MTHSLLNKNNQLKALIVSLFFIISSQNASAATDFLAQTKVSYSAQSTDQVFDTTLSKLRSLFEKFMVILDADTKIIRPLQVGGTQSNPTLKATVEKCKLFICQEVTLDAEVSVRQASGNCKKNILMTVDMRRSSDNLSEIYDQILITACYQNKNNTQAEVNFTAVAHQGPNYSQGLIQGEAIKFLRAQVPSIVNALQKSLKENGAR